MSTDYKKKYTDLVNYIPQRYHSVAGTSILRNLHNKFLTKEESAQMLGYVGDKIKNDTSPYIPATDLDREINSLIPTVYTKLGSEEYIFTFTDVLQKLKLAGVDTTDFARWGVTTGFNFVPPINLDKFTNYSRYRWYGHLIGEAILYNADMAPEYYVIGKGGKSDWSTTNFWVHEEDANEFFAAQGYSFTIDSTIQALRPIIEYDVKLEQSMVLYIANGRPGSNGIPIDQTIPGYKTGFNQKPLFNIYLHNGTHSGFVSPIFSYSEGNQYPLDSELKARIAKDNYGDFTFEQGLLSKDGQRTLFYMIDGALQTIWVRGIVEVPKYYALDSTKGIIEWDPKNDPNGVGAWKYPSQMFYNITHENRKQIGYGDLLGHFTSIIAAQDGFYGNPYGVNNFRNLPVINQGLGGRIKDYNTNFGLFLGLVNQLDSSVPSIIDFAKQQYAALLNSVSEYVSQNVGNFLNDDTITGVNPQISGAIDESLFPLYEKFLSFVSTRNDASIFSDTTSGIPGWIATIPYLGLTNVVYPSVYYEKRVNALALNHHDGHLTLLDTNRNDIEKQIANKMFVRSDGQTLPGVIGYIPPSRPYKNQFWFDANTNTLKYFVVDSDTGPMYPAVAGSTWYDRGQNTLYVFDGSVWNQQQSVNQAWVTVNVAAIIAQLTLMVERKLYHECPNGTVKYSVNTTLNSQLTMANNLLEKEFAVFAAKNNLDVGAGDYSPTNAFTWNYKGATIPGVPASTARWFAINLAYFGTFRPDLEPWVLQGYTAKPTWWDASYKDTTGTRRWTNQMWADIRNDTNATYPAPTGPWFKKLGVDYNTDALLPPYVSDTDPRSAEALLTKIPSGIADTYVFGDHGPTEMAWRFSADYQYDKLKTAFRIDPVNFVNLTWGYNNIQINGYGINRREHRKLGHHDFVLHGEAPLPKFNSYNFDKLQVLSVDDNVWTLTCVNNSANGSIFTVQGDYSGFVTRAYVVNTEYISAQIRFKLNDNSSDFNIGDKFVITKDGAVTYVPTQYSKFNGLNQWFVNLNRYNSVDMSIALADNILRDWDMKLSYRMSGLVNTELLTMRTDQFVLNDTDYKVVIKENKAISDHWLNAIRIQLIRAGTTTMVNGVNVPAGRGDDWVYRIETFNTQNPEISFYEYELPGKYLTFKAFSGAHTDVTWMKPQTRMQLITRTTPFYVTGIDNVVAILFGYVDRLNEEGWRFNQDRDPLVDTKTGRVINWQMFIEQFIDNQYAGPTVGGGYILNPFAKSVRFETPHGFVSNMRKVSMNDILSTQTIFDSFGQRIHDSDIQIFRSDQTTEIQSGVVIGGIHLIVDEFEHIALFNNYIYDQSRAKLLYDPFLGVRVNRIYMEGERQVNFNGRLSYGGHYIKDHQVARNIEASVGDMLNYYDADKMLDNSNTAKYARGLLGYDPKQYMSDIELPEKSQFGFWRGLVSNKGSNLSVNAFLNSVRFESAKIDEFWAYKLAEFGDSRQLAYPEIKMTSADAQHNSTKINFTSATQPAKTGFINIAGDDESRWVNPDDMSKGVTFTAEFLGEIAFEGIWPGQYYDLVQNGKPIIADAVQVFVEVYANTGDKTPYLIQTTNFTLINSSTITFTNDLNVDPNKYTLGAPPKFVVRCYGPSQPKFNPAKLIDYKNKVIVSDLGLWDPARGSHTPEAMEIVDIISPTEPAKYNYSVRTTNNISYDQYRPWDNKDVGRVWWNTKNLSYVPYSDVNIFPNLDSRLSYWGALADWSSIELYEWTESTVHPSKYATLVTQQEGDSSIPTDQRASGEVALPVLYSRKRTWQQRPIAWGYTDAPGSVVPYLDSVGEAQVAFRTDLSGSTVAILSANDWINTFPEIALGMKISGGTFHYNVNDVSDPENFKLTTPFGEAVVTGLNQDIVIGSSASFDAPVLNPLQYEVD